MLIDGPAGIGKTRFIEFLAWARANRFLTMQDPLILHVQSCGRVLTYLQDLIAFSLQRLLSWLAEMVAPDELDTETLALLKNRTSVIAFLENDDTPRYRRFSHCTLFNHFLSEELLDSVRRRELPKCVRRNLF